MRKHATLLGVVLLGLVSALSYAQAPVPFISQPLLPDATAPGGPQFTLTVNGTGFVSNSVVNWNGSALATQFVSGSQLTAIVPAADIATANTGWVTVVNPAPGGTSNVAFFTVTAKAKYVAFNLASSPAVGFYPTSVAVGDFNGDGKLDLAVANSYSGTVSIMLGDGTGNFTQGSSVVMPNYGLSSVAVGDFNGDGKQDLAVAGYEGSTVYILLGDGTGNFSIASSPSTPLPLSVAVGDFNGDGKLDLAVANANNVCSRPGTVSILLGDGTGNFTLASSSPVGGCPWSVAVGDFNGDGKLDLATANYARNTVSVLLGDGTGNFTLASSPPTGKGPEAVVVGDFNGDGKLDLAVLNAYGCSTCTSGSVSILLGDGTGKFKLPSPTPTDGWQSFGMAVGDFNGDGMLDLAAANEADDTVSVLLGDGKGHVTLAALPTVGGFPAAVAVGDFNGDGMLDLAVANQGDGTVSILLQVPPVLAVTLSPTSLTFGTQLVGTSSNPQPVTLTNTGNALLKIGKIAAGANFTQTNNCPTKVPAGGQCTINVTFSPTGIGTLKGAVTIKDNAPNSPQKIPLTGVGTVVTLLPSSLDFGNQKVGTTSQPQLATLTNYGTQAVSIYDIYIGGKQAGSFAQTNNCGTSVPAGGSCSISVTFTPAGKGLKTATLKVKDNGGGSPQAVALSGTGTK
jgi:hypothetical protein